MRTRGSVDARDEEPFSDEQEHHSNYRSYRLSLFFITLNGSDAVLVADESEQRGRSK